MSTERTRAGALRPKNPPNKRSRAATAVLSGRTRGMPYRPRSSALPAVLTCILFAYSPGASAQPEAYVEPSAVEPTAIELTAERKGKPPPPAPVIEPWQTNRSRELAPGYVIDQPAPDGMPLDQVRSNALMCPNYASGCQSDAGWFVAVTILHRPETWFAWGGLFEGFSVGQSWRQANNTLLLTHRAATGRLLAELHPLSSHRLDPYFGLGLGVGVIGSGADVSPHNDEPDALQLSNAAANHLSTWSPFYAARLGVDLQLIERVKLGVVADWSNFQALTGENCPWKTYGMCASSGWSAFPADNAVWKLGAALSFAFGQEL
jgi:hypothetical protein